MYKTYGESAAMAGGGGTLFEEYLRQSIIKTISIIVS